MQSIIFISKFILVKEYFLPILMYSSLQLIAFSIILTFHKRYNIKANKILVILLGFMGITLFSSALDGYKAFSEIASISYAMGFLGGPLIFFYVRTYLSNYFKFKPVYLWHLAPFMAQLFLWIIYTLSVDTNTGDSLTPENQQTLRLFFLQRDISFAIMVVFYFRLIYKAIKSYHRRAMEEYSYTNSNVLKWLYGFIVILIVVPLIVSFIEMNTLNAESAVSPIVFSVFIFLVMLIVLMRPEIYQGIGIIAPVDLKRKKNTSHLDMAQNIELFEKLVDHIEIHKSYLDPDLKLSSLAHALSTNLNYLSKAINNVANKTFNDFINFYRIEHAKKMLLNEAFSKYTISGIGRESGFKSKSAFYNAFKKYTTLSPTAYKNANVNKTSP